MVLLNRNDTYGLKVTPHCDIFLYDSIHAMIAILLFPITIHFDSNNNKRITHTYI